MEKVRKLYKLFFKIKGLGHNKSGYNNSGLMDWLDESNNLIFYTYITPEDLNHVKNGLVEELLVANFYDLKEAKHCMQQAKGIPSIFFIKANGRSFYQDNIDLSIAKKIDKNYADFLIEDNWTLFSENFTSIEIIKKKIITKDNLKNKTINFKTKKI